MSLLNYYSIAHFCIWLFVGRYTRIGWATFLALSLSWELLELVLPFEFAVESAGNKLADVVINVFGFGLGSRFRKTSQPT